MSSMDDVFNFALLAKKAKHQHSHQRAFKAGFKRPRIGHPEMVSNRNGQVCIKVRHPKVSSSFSLAFRSK